MQALGGASSLTGELALKATEVPGSTIKAARRSLFRVQPQNGCFSNALGGA